MATPYATVHLGTVDSTQDEARSRATAGDQPVLVVAERQTTGRGRSGRRWEQAPRALFSSLAFFPSWPAETWPRLTLVAGLAVHGALAAHTEVEPGLKWPNDLVSGAGKLGGILTEAEAAGRGGLVVIGCGVNLWWPDPDRPAGVAAACDQDPGRDLARRLAAAWATEVLEVMAEEPDAWDRTAYRAACVTLGAEIAWEPDGTGTAVDIDGGGGLVVETATGTVTLVAGEVHNVRRR